MSFSYARNEISSFVVAWLRPYIRCMENRDLNQYPGVEELYALERQARLERSRWLAALVRKGFIAVRRAYEARGQKGLRHA